MEAQAIFWVFYLIYLASFFLDFYVTWRQYQVYRRTEKRPKNVADIISEEDFVKARNYKLDKMYFGLFLKAFGKVESTFLLFFQLMPWAWTICGRLSTTIWTESGEIFQSIVFMCFTGIIEMFFTLPFSYYDTFYIEQKHGFNKETIPFFFKDRLKKLLIGLVITAPITASYIFIFHWGGPNSYVYVWLFISSTCLYTLNSLRPCSTRSKRSAHSCAYIYGFWKNNRIVLYDTLFSEEMNQRKRMKDGEEDAWTKAENGTSEKDSEEPTTAEPKDEEKRRNYGLHDDEVVAVLVHELGHWKDLHSMYMLAFSEINLFIMFLVFAFFYRQQESLFVAFGFLPAEQPVYIGLMLVLQYLIGPYQEMLSLLIAVVGRRFEFAADRFAARLGFATKLQSALIKLGKNNLSLPIDDWLYSACKHSHPPILERVKALKKFE